MPDEKDPRIITPMPAALLAEIDEYRFSRRVASRAEAVRRLIERGLREPPRESAPAAPEESQPAPSPMPEAHVAAAVLAPSVYIKEPLTVTVADVIKSMVELLRDEKAVVTDVLFTTNYFMVHILECLPPDATNQPAVQALLGGAEYLQACAAWFNALRVWNNDPWRIETARPRPPPLPGSPEAELVTRSSRGMSEAS